MEHATFVISSSDTDITPMVLNFCCLKWRKASLGEIAAPSYTESSPLSTERNLNAATLG